MQLSEIHGPHVTIFNVTVPSAGVSATLAILRKNGVGVSVGRIVLTSLEFLKPGLDKPLSLVVLKAGTNHAEAQDILIEAKSKVPKSKPVAGFAHFQKARRTTEELYNEINGNANITGLHIIDWRIYLIFYVQLIHGSIWLVRL